TAFTHVRWRGAASFLGGKGQMQGGGGGSSSPRLSRKDKFHLVAASLLSNQEASADLLVALHRDLLKVRLTEEILAERYREQEMRTPAHFGWGQEAVAVGVCSALRADDVVFSHHRCHNHYLAKGGSVYQLAAELYGRADGCSGGRGGSVHLTARDQGMIATSAILGEMTAVAVGAALAFKMDSLNRVAVTFFGEGAMDEGAFYEAPNYYSNLKLT